MRLLCLSVMNKLAEKHIVVSQLHALCPIQCPCLAA